MNVMQLMSLIAAVCLSGHATANAEERVYTIIDDIDSKPRWYCYDTSRSGEKIAVPCEMPSEIMTASEIEASLTQFRAFENSDIAEAVFEAARIRDAQPKPKKSPYMEKITAKELERSKHLTWEQIQQEELVKAEAHQKIIQARLKERRESTLPPEIDSKVGRIINGRYRVKLVFMNDADFPMRYSGYTVFRKNTTEEFARDWEDIIFRHYLKEDYKQYQPELDAVNEYVIIMAFVDNSDELERIVTDQPIKSIYHIGTPIGVGLEEATYLPVPIKQ